MLTYTNNEFPGEFIPSIFDNCCKMEMIDDKPFQLNLWDANGGRGDFEDRARLRPLSYPQTDIFVVCFAINNKKSFENVKTLWIPEINHHCRETPWILVGTKSDLKINNDLNKDSNNNEFVSIDQINKILNELKGKAYIECSALKKENLKEIFCSAARFALYL